MASSTDGGAEEASTSGGGEVEAAEDQPSAGSADAPGSAAVAATATSARAHAGPPWVVVPMSPPVRLRMTSADRLCPRAMLVEWEDGSAERQRWLSSEDPLHNGWYEAERLLPPTATNITVQFKVKGPHKKWDVCAVDRRDGCAWVKPGKDRYAPEVICFRVGAGHFDDPIDTVFELRGPIHRCFVQRAWNAARATASDPEEWECWDDQESRPPSEGCPSTLLAADAASKPGQFDDAEAYLDAATQRVCAATTEILSVHRETLRALEGLDASCTGQWLRSNMGTSLSAGLFVAAVPATILLPPVGIGLAIAGSVTGTAAMGGSSLEERWTLAQLRSQLSRDSWNAFVVAELLKEWIRASEVAGRGQLQREGAGEGVKRSSSTVEAVKNAAMGVALIGDEVSAALPVLGPAGIILGAVLTTGLAVHGWTSSKFSQKEVRGKLAELRDRLLFFQFFLARLGRLSCAGCGQSLSEREPVRRCSKYLHYCRPGCMLTGEGGSLRCPVCGGPVDHVTGSLTDHATDSAHSRQQGHLDFGASTSPTAGDSHQQSAAAQADAGGASGEAAPTLDDGLLLQFQERLVRLTDAFEARPADRGQALGVVADMRACEADSDELRLLSMAAADREDGVEVILGIADALERWQGLSEAYSAWEAQAPSEWKLDAQDALDSSGAKTKAGAMVTSALARAGSSASSLRASGAASASASLAKARVAAQSAWTRAGDSHHESASAQADAGGASGEAAPPPDDGLLLQFQERLVRLTEALEAPPADRGQALGVVADMRACEADSDELRLLSMAAAEREDGVELILGIADALERWQGLSEAYSAWEAQAPSEWKLDAQDALDSSGAKTKAGTMVTSALARAGSSASSLRASGAASAGASLVKARVAAQSAWTRFAPTARRRSSGTNASEEAHGLVGAREELMAESPPLPPPAEPPPPDMGEEEEAAVARPTGSEEGRRSSEPSAERAAE